MENIMDYAQGLNASKEIKEWLNTTAKKKLKENKTNTEKLEHIVDYLVSAAAPVRLRRMSYNDAERKAEEWSKANQKKGRGLVDTEKDISVVHDFLDGTTIVRLLTKQALQREGFLMNHCVGGYDPNNEDVHIYSYRDKKNIPHATFEVQRSYNEIVQIKGKGNGSIHPKYVNPILTFLKTISMDVRPSDMKHLGYYHLPKEHLDFVKSFDKTFSSQIVAIHGEHYAF